ncbi:hypothetical protein ABBQ38_012986 [Trebouxia sp. C0009 RCD-2024]
MNLTKKLINEPKNAVTEYLEGYVSSVEHVQLLEGAPEINVVTQIPPINDSKVAIISGGGGGHEPGQAGYVGKGMLAAAVSGHVFASPSAKAVLAAIRAVAGKAGCLLIVYNYTGDKLQFGLAVEKAKAEGHKVEMVLVADDCSLPGQGVAGRRGISGALLVTKIAGAAAAGGLSLKEVAAVATDTAKQCRSVGVATRICTLPGAAPSDRLGEDEMEVGMGLHAEPGASRQKMQSANDIVKLCIDCIQQDGAEDLPAGCQVAMVVNNLGSTPVMEMYIAARAALRYAQEKHKVKVVRLYVGTFFTSLDMQGASISLLPVESGRLARLDSPTQAPFWPKDKCIVVPDKPKAALPLAPNPEAQTSRPDTLSEQGQLLEKALLSAAAAILDHAQELDDWDQRVGDGDCGTTLAQGARAIRADCCKRYPLNDAAATMNAVAGSVGHSMGGSSGALYQIFFVALAAALKETQTADAWGIGAQAGLAAIQHYGGAKPGDRTMLDALAPAIETFRAKSRSGGDAVTALQAAASAAASGAERTKTMRAGAGRSSYVPEAALHNTADPGASAVAIWLQAVAVALK